MSSLLRRMQKLVDQCKEVSYQYNMLEKELVTLRKQRKAILKELKASLEALALIKHVGAETQKNTVYKIENLVTIALRDVFGEDGYDFEMELSYDKRSMSVDFFLVRDEERYDPLECCGYGVVDVACFALRVAIWSLNPSRKTMILDEPFKNVSQEYRLRVGQFVKKVSEQLGFQFIITTHMPELSVNAHKVFMLKKCKGQKTSIEEVDSCGHYGR